MASSQAIRRKLSIALELACWLLPASRRKNWLLTKFGHTVASTAHIGPTITVGVAKFTIGEHVRIGLLNVFRGMSTVWLEDYVIIDSFNWISANPLYQQLDPEAGTLFMGIKSRVGSRCYIDCSGTIVIRAFGAVGGVRCVLQSHQPDLEHNRQSAGRITVGDHAWVASCAVMLKGSSLPEKSLLAANATMTPSSAEDGKSGLYVGSPAKWKSETTGAFFDRLTYWITENVIDEPMGIAADDVSDSYKSRIIGAPE
jgi:acetyltransferase-like isoleucine patch superfamily enzyme